MTWGRVTSGAVILMLALLPSSEFTIELYSLVSYYVNVSVLKADLL